MKAKILAIFMISAMLFCMIPSAVTAADFSANVGKEEIPYGPENLDVQAYAPNGFNMMTTAEAAAAGVPAGYTGNYVLALSGTESGIMLDKRVPFASVESVTFRVYCPDQVKEFRITDCKGVDWIVREVPTQRNAWIDITFSPTSNNYYTEYVSHGFYEFEGDDGYFKPVNVGFRFTSESTAYIDSITFTYNGTDLVPPVISYEGATEITTTAGKPFSIDATAFDAYENRNIELSYSWSDGALDERDLPVKGDHTCTVSATDLSGNRSELVLSVHVTDADAEAPVIAFSAGYICVPVGTINMLEIEATDNCDEEVEVVLTWTDGAFDSRGRFAAGAYALTITATDATGNTSTHYVMVNVSDSNVQAEKVLADTQ